MPLRFYRLQRQVLSKSLIAIPRELAGLFIEAVGHEGIGQTTADTDLGKPRYSHD